MIKRRGLAMVIVSLILALAAAGLARAWLQTHLAGSPMPADPGMPVVVASMDIPFGTKIEPRHLRMITLPHGVPVGNHYDTPEAVVGLIAVQRIVAGEILLKQQFADHASGSTLAALLKPDMRAVTVRVDDVVGVAGFLLPGNHVDVVAGRLVNQRAETQTVLTNLTVLAVDQTDSRDKNAPVVVRAVTLEMTPRQAEILLKAEEEGKIQLTLRNPLAPDSAPPPPPQPAPEKIIVHRVHRDLPRPQESAVTIIRGTKVQNAGSSS